MAALFFSRESHFPQPSFSVISLIVLALAMALESVSVGIHSRFGDRNSGAVWLVMRIPVSVHFAMIPPDRSSSRRSVLFWAIAKWQRSVFTAVMRR
jgi:hypothetical protein